MFKINGFFGAFAATSFKNAPISFALSLSACLSVTPRKITQKPLDRFSLNLKYRSPMGVLLKLIETFQFYLKLDKKSGHLT
jgi:hypothetical protein